jgi:hypothetical protein
MGTAKPLTSPLLLPFRLLWNAFALVGRTIFRVVTFSLKLAILLLVVVLLLLWFGR